MYKILEVPASLISCVLTLNNQMGKHWMPSLCEGENSILLCCDIFKILYIYCDRSFIDHIWLKSLYRYKGLSEIYF